MEAKELWKEDHELLKWGSILKVVALILIFADVFPKPSFSCSLQFAAAAAALTAGVFDLIRHKKFRAKLARFHATIWIASGIYFLFMGILLLMVKVKTS